MRHVKFDTGGFALFGVTPATESRGKLAAWYDKSGTLLDCELINSRGASRRPGRVNADKLERLGRVYAGIKQ